MGRRRSYRNYRRQHSPPRSYTWQTYAATRDSGNLASGGTYKGSLGVMTPGVGALGSERAFDAPHVLQRIRGQCFHSLASSDNLARLDIAALRIPSEFASLMSAETTQDDIIDITNNLEGDDYLWYESCFCGALVDSPISMIDNKAKRKLDVGDVIGWFYKLVNLDTVTIALKVSINARILWSLKQ